MGNRYDGCHVVVLDHAYNFGDGASDRGDGYMNAYQKVLSSCPWMPVVGAQTSGWHAQLAAFN